MISKNPIDALQEEVDRRKSRLTAIRSLLKKEGLSFLEKDALKKEEKLFKKKWWEAAEKLKQLKLERKIST